MHFVTKEEDIEKVDFLAGALLAIDKPIGWTSFDVVNKLRFAIKYQLGVKKIKVGHAGTLDPLATGLLLICTGKATKKIESLQGQEKAYVAEVKFGATTPTYDAEMEEEGAFEIAHLTQGLIEEGLNKFKGEIDQVPPIYSALKKDGKALYKYARQGKKVEIKSRKVTIYRLELTDWQSPKAILDMTCSKGTYVRSLAHDLGKSLDSGAYLTGLRRMKIGDYSVEKAWELDALIKVIQASDLTIAKAENS